MGSIWAQSSLNNGLLGVFSSFDRVSLHMGGLEPLVLLRKHISSTIGSHNAENACSKIEELPSA